MGETLSFKPASARSSSVGIVVARIADGFLLRCLQVRYRCPAGFEGT